MPVEKPGDFQGAAITVAFKTKAASFSPVSLPFCGHSHPKTTYSTLKRSSDVNRITVLARPVRDPGHAQNGCAGNRCGKIDRMFAWIARAAALATPASARTRAYRDQRGGAGFASARSTASTTAVTAALRDLASPVFVVTSSSVTAHRHESGASPSKIK